MTQVFKFGGASIQDAAAIRRVGELLARFRARPLIVVVSAMGKTTNALETLLAAARAGETEEYRDRLETLRQEHLTTVEALFGDRAGPVTERVEALITELDQLHRRHASRERPFHYDQTVCYGELLSTTIISAWLDEAGMATEWLDARDLVVTDDCHQAANVDWQATVERVRGLATDDDKIRVTQGFIGGTTEGVSTTLGREGSDFSAAILAHCLDAEEVTIWKDVPGLFNADPRRFDNAVQLERISYDEAIELAWHGAKVIHPKTLGPLQQKSIPLTVRSFEDLEAPPSTIGRDTRFDTQTPSLVLLEEQTLLEIRSRDFAFMDEPRQHDILGRLVEAGLHASLIDAGAMRLSLCLDDGHPDRLEPLVSSLCADYAVVRHEDLTLLTVRHADDALLAALSAGRDSLAERRNADTAQRLFPSTQCQGTWHIPL
ncbi:aspartate kinase [Halomonas lysinitropha]|uniref:Aspartokinase n=1 Tax=Halomonas lysinitropha TaxID=2607506 RepID=A0A5K1I5G1_9GAMM|nr:aspartate kinase [Halomonas lysinitropha]VVZ94422.1 Lysine-sensitive aspartokinase 3 [Halomonas lysinitropha]